jgi:hypothetical protein
MKYQWTDSERRVVHIIDDDGKSRKSMLVVGRDQVIDSDFEKYKRWIASGNSVLEQS